MGKKDKNKYLDQFWLHIKAGLSLKSTDAAHNHAI